MKLLDVVAKPEGDLLLVEPEPARKYVCEERVYWRVIDSLGNEIWFTERRVSEDRGRAV